MALVLKADGDIVPLCINPSTKQMQDAVGGYIECVRIFDGRHMYVNEDGKRMGLSHNSKASQMAGTPIVGDVVLFDGQETMEDLESRDEVIMIDPLSSSILTIPLGDGNTNHIAKTIAGMLGADILQEEE
tara:strand:- start:1384 stop:1773 length:390 start_codon:yes stop_codon:yes gene_type:complete